ncbi:MAG: NADH-quinone oxidoreductase subunit N [Bdellovibrionales bacterium]|nr:NADH-quinone oxidoreductase subunit N [Bdellovibrionales bacterium]
MNWVADNIQSFAWFWPEALLALGSIICLLLSAFYRKNVHISFGIATVTLIAYICVGFYHLFFCDSGSSNLFVGHVKLDGLGQLLRVLFGFLGLITMHMGFVHQETRKNIHFEEIPSFLLVITLGMSMMAWANSLLMVFLAVEMVSIPSYILVGIKKSDRFSAEAGIKYLLFGAFASGVMLFGISYLYGIFGSGDFSILMSLLDSSFPMSSMGWIAMSLVCIFCGVAYKIAAFPSHMWCPDVYEAAPSPITSFLSVGPKVAGVALILRILLLWGQNENLSMDQEIGQFLQRFLIFMSAITMTVGNLGALGQVKMKRLMAYSSIAHAGYLLMGLACFSTQGFQASIIYFLIYFFMNVGCFYIIVAMENEYGSDDIQHFTIFAKHFPLVMALMTVFLFSLVGLPPFAGFIGKFYLFSVVIEQKMYGLAVIAAINTAISLFYYAKILKTAYFSGEDTDIQPQTSFSWSISLMCILMAVPTVFLLLQWKPLLTLVEKASASL